MNIVVCLKQILDPEIPSREFRVDARRLEADRGSAPLVTSIFCENALETACQIRDRAGGEITALTFGPATADETLRKALALKADHACRVHDPGTARPCPAATARVLAAAIGQLSRPDLIMVGREAGDWGAGQTGGLLAEELSLPFVAFVDSVQVSDAGVTLQRQTESGWERLVAELPLVVSVTNSDQNVPRHPKTRDILMSGRKPIKTMELADLGLTADDLASNETEVVDLQVPMKQVQCEFVTGDSFEERIDDLARRIAAVVK